MSAGNVAGQVAADLVAGGQVPCHPADLRGRGLVAGDGRGHLW
jgi:hypothetical protein